MFYLRRCPKCRGWYVSRRSEQRFCRRNCGRWQHHTAIDSRLEDRPPADQEEAYLAALIATDGCVEYRAGRSEPTCISLKMAAIARPLLEEIGRHFGRRVYTRRNGQVVMTFIDLPVAWKWQAFPVGPELRPHYIRGLLDGDGCISGARSKAGFDPFISLSYNPRREPWVAETYRFFLTAHGIKFSEHADPRASVSQIRSWGEMAVRIATLVYGIGGFEHPEKGARARALIEGRAGDWVIRPYRRAA